MKCHCGGQNYETLLIVMANINILYEITEKLRLLIVGKSVFYKQYLSKGIRYTKDLP